MEIVQQMPDEEKYKSFGELFDEIDGIYVKSLVDFVDDYGAEKDDDYDFANSTYVQYLYKRA